jgi:hypothetical protein
MKLKDGLASGGYRGRRYSGYFNGYDKSKDPGVNGHRRRVYEYEIERFIFHGKNPGVALMRAKRFDESGNYLDSKVVCLAFHLDDDVVR